MSTTESKRPAKRHCRRDPFRLVRFKAEEPSLSRHHHNSTEAENARQNLRPRQIKNRSGCEPCKKRHIKCDERQPACVRCQRSNITCTGLFKPDMWQMERPWLYNTHERVQTLEGLLIGHGVHETGSRKCPRLPGALENELLRHWFENACTFMGIVPQSSNPLSYGISPYLQQSRALRHSIQCISQAHLDYFSDAKLPGVLDERSRALASLRFEIEKAFTKCNSSVLRQRCLQTILLSSLMLGITSRWVDREWSGVQFLAGARHVVPLLLECDQVQDTVPRYIVGLYLYWEGVSSHMEPCEPPQTPDLQLQKRKDRLHQLSFLQGIARDRLGGYIHPVTGLAAEIFPLIGAAGRYYRSLIHGCPEDPAYVGYLEAELEKWEPAPPSPSEDGQKLLHLAEAYRALVGLLLYQAQSLSQAGENPMRYEDAQIGIAKVMHVLEMVSLGDPLLSSVGPFIVIAGSELKEDEVERRELVRRVATDVTSYTRVTAFAAAFELVQDVWTQRASGRRITWLELMLENKTCLSLA